LPLKTYYINLITLLFASLFASTTLVGQNIELQTISSGGGLLKSSSGSHSLSITSGQAIITTAGSQNKLTQGFQQIDCNLNPEIFDVAPICENGAPVNLMATLQGGVFEGLGVSGGQFFPENVGAGNYQIAYRIEINGCKDSAFSTIKVKPKPLVTHNITDTTCKSGLVILLDQGSPTGGSYSGLGVFGTMFNPNLAGTGLKPIYYSFTDTNTCSAADTGSVFVKNNPIVTLANQPIICPGTDTVILTGGQPTGGYFTGNGVKNNLFIADSAAFGLQLLTYNYLDTTNGCTGFAQKSIVNDSIPSNLSLNLPSGLCNNLAPFFLNAGLPLGGLYSGVPQAIDSSGFLIPQNLNSGSYPLNYNYTSPFGCLNTVADTLVIFNNPTVTLSPINIVCSNDTIQNLNSGLPIGGTYLGPAISANQLNPKATNPGSYPYYYQFVDATTGCSTLDTSTFNIVTPIQSQLNFPAIICENIADINLNLFVNNNNPLFSGVGVVDSIYNPAIIGGGNVSSIKIEATDTNGCFDVDSVSITIGTKPNVSLSINSVCENINKFNLKGGTPLGGIYAGNTVDQFGFFYPTLAANPTPITYSYTTSQGCTAIDTFNLSMFNVIKPKIDTIPAICSNDDTIQLSVSTAGGSFSGSAVTGSNLIPKNLGLGATQVYYQRTDGNGCIAKDTLVTTVIRAPVITQNLNRKICSGESADFYLADNLNYIWSDGKIGNKNSFSPIINTTYSISVTNGICGSSKSFRVDVNQTPQIIENVILPSCESENGRIEVSANGSNGPFSYAWSSGHNNPVALNLKAGVYELTITDIQSCETVKTYGLSNANTTVIANSNITDPTCFNNNNGAINLTLNNPSNLSYNWLDGSKTINRNNLFAGSYYFIAEEENTGCKGVEEFVVNNPSLITTTPQVIPSSCNLSSGSISLISQGGIGNLNYNWSSSETSSSIVNKQTGVYSVTVEDDNNCTITKDFFIPNTERVYVNLDSLVLPTCNNNDGKISLKPLSPNYSYSWNVGGTNSFVNKLSEGLVITTITNSNCSFVLPFKLENENPLAPEICNVSIDTSTNQAVVMWEGDGTNQTLHRKAIESSVFQPIYNTNSNSKEIFVDTNYTASPVPFTYAIQSENNCNNLSGLESVNYSIYLSTIQIAGGKIRAAWQDAESNLANISTYKLYAKVPSGNFNEIASITPPTNFYDLDSLGSISEFLIAAEITNCGVSDIKFSNISSNISSDPNLYLASKNGDQDAVLFPNPSNEFSYVNFLKAPKGELTLTVMGSKGELIWQQVLNTNGNQKLFEIPVDQFASGSYSVKINNNLFTQTLRLMVN